MPKPLILVASSETDKDTWEPVVRRLSKRCRVIVYEADRVASGDVRLDIAVSCGSTLELRYDGTKICPEGVAAGWFRRPTLFMADLPDKALELGLDTERRLLQNGIWELVPEGAWLSSPFRLRQAEFKLVQLGVARDVGFHIPTTIVTNSWEAIELGLSKDILFKPSYGMFYRDNQMQLLYATRLPNDQGQLPTSGNPFPGIWQNYLEKAREWRITVVDDEAFDAAIYTSSEAKGDWRAHQLSSHVEFRAERFPEVEKLKCREYLRRMNLGFGAFDFVEDEDGRITFLECNANGQYGWLEDTLGFPLSAAIAEALVRRAVG